MRSVDHFTVPRDPYIDERTVAKIGADMTRPTHYRALERMYLAAPINGFYLPTIEVSEGMATVEIDVSGKYFHAMGAAHGSVIFKMLDDASFFASNSLELEVFVLTTAFTTYLTRPISVGTLRSVGRVVNRTRSQFVAEAVAYDGKGKEVGRGSGIFVKSKHRLDGAPGYGA